MTSPAASSTTRPDTAAEAATRCSASAGRHHDRLSTKARARLETGLFAGDPTGETTLAWTVAQDLMALYQLTNPEQARTRATELITNLGAARYPRSPN